MVHRIPGGLRSGGLEATYLSKLLRSSCDKRRSFPMIPPHKRAAEAASTSPMAMKKACSDVMYDSAATAMETELKEEPVKLVNEEIGMQTAPAQNELDFCILEGIRWDGVPYEKLYLAFKEIQRMFLQEQPMILDDMEKIRHESIKWKDLPEKISLMLFKRSFRECIWLHSHELFEKWLLKSIDLILEKSLTLRQVIKIVNYCDVEDVNSDFASYPGPDVEWVFMWWKKTETPWIPKRAKNFRHNCIHHPFYDGYDPYKEFENCNKNCVNCRKLLPVLRKLSEFMQWLSKGTTKVQEFIYISSDSKCPLLLNGFAIPDEVINDCKEVFDLPKELIRDCIYDTIIIKWKEDEVKNELEALHHIIGHKCAQELGRTQHSVCDEMVAKFHGRVFEYVIAVGQELIDHFSDVLKEQIKEYKSCVCYYFGYYDGLEQSSKERGTLETGLVVGNIIASNATPRQGHKNELSQVAGVLTQALESAQAPKGEKTTEVVNTDSPVKVPQKTEGRREVSVMHQTLAGVSLKPGKILLKDENIEQFLPMAGVTLVSGQTKMPLVVCGPAPLGRPVPPPSKAERPSFPRLLPVAPEVTLDLEGTRSGLGDRLYEIRREEEKIVENTSQIAEVVKNLDKKIGERETQYLKRIAELERALAAIIDQSRTNPSEELMRMHDLEEKLASLTLKNAEWAGKAEIARGEFHRTIFDIGQAHFVHVKDLQKRIKELDDEKKVLRKERNKLRGEVADAKEIESKARQMAFDAHR
ncbi:hypothetical protein AXF42_Ash004686 [Apostasia shenzhenica]|uniref:Uncharacterized protein n=1 Tax=Apostasia shenzhenica TaxID=1088818 RepID=A0A2I0BHE7_9ASPA|nr:hypothetical protein AXF42_Ash004686 [Apostasia shenzhenica]